MVIHNGLVLNQNFEFQKCDLQFSSKIEKMEDKIEDAEGIDAADLYVMVLSALTRIPANTSRNIRNICGRTALRPIFPLW